MDSGRPLGRGPVLQALLFGFEKLQDGCYPIGGFYVLRAAISIERHFDLFQPVGPFVARPVQHRRPDQERQFGIAGGTRRNHEGSGVAQILILR